MDNRVDSLLAEYVDVSNAFVLSLEDGDAIDRTFNKMCPMTTWGKVNWDHFTKKIVVGLELNKVIPALQDWLGDDFDKEVYVTCDVYIPIIKTTIDAIIKNFSQFERIAREKFVFNPIGGYVVEVRFSGITVGLFPTYDKFLKKETYVDPDILQHNETFKKCVEALKITLLPIEEEKKLDTWFRKHVPITKWGYIDWDLFECKERIGYEPKMVKRGLSEVLDLKGHLEKTVYIAWSEVGIPIIKTNLDHVLANFDQIASVSFEKFLFNPSLGYVVEILDSRRVTIGLV